MGETKRVCGVGPVVAAVLSLGCYAGKEAPPPFGLDPALDDGGGDGDGEAGDGTDSDPAGGTDGGAHDGADTLPGEGTDGADGDPDDDDAGGTEGPEVSAYDENLAKILASTFRNPNEDDSPHLYTPSADLYDEPDLYGTVADYKTKVGNYNGDVYYEYDYFPNNGAIAAFRSQCEVSHFAYDDPTIYPGMPEASPLMMFIGNTHTNAYSTYDTIMNSGGSTCNGGELNRTAYWVPAVFDGKGNVVVPSKMKFYYKTEKSVGLGKVALYPENLQLIADRSNNVEPQGSTSTFRCNDIYNGGATKHIGSNTIPVCNDAGGIGVLEMQVFFDHCWNGEESTVGDWWQNNQVNLRPPDVHWFSSVCPASHPILLPALVTHIFFDIKPGEDTSTWFLSTDVSRESRQVEGVPGEGAFAGWFGGWNKEINAEFNEHCNNTPAECASGMLADADDARALRLRNDWITGHASQYARIAVQDVYEQLCTASGPDETPFDPAGGGAMAAHCRPEALPPN